jgi:hypothetical protein
MSMQIKLHFSVLKRMINTEAMPVRPKIILPNHVTEF